MGYMFNGVDDGGCPFALVKRVIEGFDVPYFIETGTAGAYSVTRAAEIFSVCHTIEIVAGRTPFKRDAKLKLEKDAAHKAANQLTAEPFKNGGAMNKYEEGGDIPNLAGGINWDAINKIIQLSTPIINLDPTLPGGKQTRNKITGVTPTNTPGASTLNSYALPSKGMPPKGVTIEEEEGGYNIKDGINYGAASGCNISLNHKDIPSHRLHIIYYNFPGFNKKKIKITKSIEKKIIELYESKHIGEFDNLFIIINENLYNFFYT